MGSSHSSIADQFLGTWTCTNSENLEAYLKEIGANRKICEHLSHEKSTLTLEVEGGEYTLIFVSPVKSHVMKFKLGQEFENISFDGRQVITKFELDGPKLIQTDTAKGNGKDSRIEATVSGDTLTTVEECNGIKAINTYVRSEKEQL